MPNEMKKCEECAHHDMKDGINRWSYKFCENCMYFPYRDDCFEAMADLTTEEVIKEIKADGERY